MSVNPVKSSNEMPFHNFFPSGSSSSSIQGLNSRISNLSDASEKNKLQNLGNSREVTSFIENGKVLSQKKLSQAITKRISGIYSADSVTVNDVHYTLPGIYHIVNGQRREKIVPARKIEIKRTWCLYDVVPLGVFLPTLLKKDSVYRKTIQTGLIRDFVLDAKPNDLDISELLDSTDSVLSKSHPQIEPLESFKEFIRKKHSSDADLAVVEKDRDVFKEDFENLKVFVTAFKSLYDKHLEEGKKQLDVAFWQSKSITIYLPVELYDAEEKLQLSAYIEAPKTEGFATPWAISIAKMLRKTNTQGYELLNSDLDGGIPLGER